MTPFPAGSWSGSQVTSPVFTARSPRRRERDITRVTCSRAWRMMWGSRDIPGREGPKGAVGGAPPRGPSLR